MKILCHKKVGWQLMEGNMPELHLIFPCIRANEKENDSYSTERSELNEVSHVWFHQTLNK